MKLHLAHFIYIAARHVSFVICSTLDALFHCCRFFVIFVLQQLSLYIKSKQDYERERSLFITSILLTECLSCVDVLVVSLLSIELICFQVFISSSVVA